MFCYLLVKSESLDNSLLFFEYLLLRNAHNQKKKGHVHEQIELAKTLILNVTAAPIILVAT